VDDREGQTAETTSAEKEVLIGHDSFIRSLELGSRRIIVPGSVSEEAKAP
jgi:hypothetical protein